MADTAQSPAKDVTVDEKAVKEIAQSEFYAFLGEDKVRRIARAAEITGAAELRNMGRWLTPSARQEVLRILAPELPSISETFAWMVVRRYRELKRWTVEQALQAEKKRLEEEAKAKLAAEKAAKAAAAKKAAEAKAAEGGEAAPAKGGEAAPAKGGEAAPAKDAAKP
jgi:hypothetical protein